MHAPEQHGFLYYNWGNVASIAGLMISVAGLIITVFTLRAAQSAKVASEEARSAARIRNLVEELRRGEILVRDLATHLAAGLTPQATLRARDLVDALSWLVGSSRLEGEAGSRILEAKTHAEAVVSITRGGSNKRLAVAQRNADLIYEALVSIRASVDQ